jgi:hypothetical protein
MAKPIKETPVLIGEDAKKFLRHIEEAKSIKITKEEVAKMKDNFSRLHSIAKF